ncbi:MAG: ATP-dependent DNA helicase [Mariprofundaceae bacterium]|nr:ATP-dependent DNA helicase [Mariprofundaceae bacterium]
MGTKTSDFVTQIEKDFDCHSALAAGLAAYVYREEQVKLAVEIAECFDQGNVLLAEAETGTGKTLAYLIPALRFDGKVLISTHTKSLQNQLVHRDIPAVTKAMGVRRKIALLKGRSNYLCPFRLQKSLTAASLELWTRKSLLRVVKWAEGSVDGDLSTLSFDPFEKGVGAMITATADQCSGSKCPEFKKCPLMKAREKAMQADIVVSNHALLLADAALKSGDFGELLPQFDVYILDEAHSLPDVACQHFGIQLARMHLISWLNDFQKLLDELGDEDDLKQQTLKTGRVLLSSWLESGLDKVAESWQLLVDFSASRAERNEDLAKISERAEKLSQDMQALQTAPEGFVAWTEGEGEFKRYLLAPIETGSVLDEHLWVRTASFVLLSATLRVSGHFDYARERLGLQNAREVFHSSPFDYDQQALTYLPRHLPDPRSDAGKDAQLEEMIRLLNASQGRAFVLFTSWSALSYMGEGLSKRLQWPVLIQGKSGSRDAILEKFREDTHSILCGTRSFWEGVDVPGETLSMVIVDKVPFAPPSDPLLKARIALCEERGGNGFMDIQLPEAIAVLRQGVGRLIRSNSDRGVMAILDSRLYHKRYGRDVAYNLPPARIVDDIVEVRCFFEAP